MMKLRNNFGVNNEKKKPTSICVNISYIWLGSWDRDHITKKYYEALFSTNLTLSDEIEEKKYKWKNKVQIWQKNKMVRDKIKNK